MHKCQKQSFCNENNKLGPLLKVDITNRDLSTWYIDYFVTIHCGLDVLRVSPIVPPSGDIVPCSVQLL